ncbi:MAG: RNase adapter RapZ [Alphaproteobacteria bacterium]|jgi:UPF0042 nucleotide-binding protein
MNVPPPTTDGDGPKAMRVRGSHVGRTLLVTGMSGAGRTSALKALEDIGYEAVDNLPLRLMPGLVLQGPAPGHGLAIGIDVRTRDLVAELFAEDVEQLRRDSGKPIDIVFLDCDDEMLRRRYTETRRVHPIAGDRPLADAIAEERRLLQPLREAADIVIDTSHTNARDLTRILRDMLGGGGDETLHVSVVSFAFRNGIPRDADLVFDVRFLRNPHYDPALRPLTGLDAAVGAYIEEDPDYATFFERLTGMLDLLLPRYRDEGKSYLTIAIGCTGGQHRSVYTTQKLAAWLGERMPRVDVRHRELAAAEKTR